MSVGDINAMAAMVAEHNEEEKPAEGAWEKVHRDYVRLFNQEPELGERVLTDILTDLYYFDTANTAAKVVLQNYARLLLRKLGSFDPNARREHTKQLIRTARVRVAQED